MALLYLGAGHDVRTVTRRRMAERYPVQIFVDALPLHLHYLPGMNGYAVNKDVVVFVAELERLLRTPSIRTGNEIRFTTPRVQLLYIINTTVEEFLVQYADRLPTIAALKIAGFEPREAGLSFSQLPALDKVINTNHRAVVPAKCNPETWNYG